MSIIFMMHSKEGTWTTIIGYDSFNGIINKLAFTAFSATFLLDSVIQVILIDNKMKNHN